MVEKIDLQKIFSPISATVKVKKVKQRHTNMQQRGFERHLQEEEGKKGKEDTKLSATGEAGKEEKEREHLSETTSERCQNPSIEKEPDDHTPGALIDILV